MLDNALMEKFQQEIWNKVPHREEKDGKIEIVNATPLVDLTADLKECAKTVYDVDLSEKNFKLYGKFDNTLLTGSIKVRPAVNIIHDAITTGKISSGTKVIEATSGNFGIALGILSKIDVTAIAMPNNPAKWFVKRIPTTIIKEGIAVASIEIAKPCITLVPCPVVEDFATLFTGL